MNLDELKSKIGGKIKQFRKIKGYTQEQLAEKLGIDHRHLSGIETGSNTPSLKLLLAISNALDIEIRVLFDFQNDNNLRQEIHDIIDIIDDKKLIMLRRIFEIIFEQQNFS